MYFNLFKPIQSAAGQEVLKSAAYGVTKKTCILFVGLPFSCVYDCTGEWDSTGKWDSAGEWDSTTEWVFI